MSDYGDSWEGFSFFQNFSPKVVLPFVLTELTTIIIAVGDGVWDSENTLLAVVGFVAATLGFAAKPAPQVDQDEVARLSKAKTG